MEPAAPINLAGHESEIFFIFFFFQEAAKVALEFGESEVEGEELPWAAVAESRRYERRRQALCSWKVQCCCLMALPREGACYPFHSWRTALQRNTVT